MRRGRAMSRKLGSDWRGRRITEEERITIYRCIAEGLKAGLGLPDILEALAEEGASPRMAVALRGMAADLREGVPFREAVFKHPRAIPPEHAEALAAAEEGGALEGALRDIADHLERMWASRLRIRSAYIYPAVVTIYALVIFWNIFSFIIPNVYPFWMELGLTQFIPPLVKLGFFISKVSPYLVAFLAWLLIFGPVASFYLRRFRRGRRFMDRLTLLIPGLGRGVLLSALARYAGAFGLLVKNGVPDLKALKVAPRLSGNELVREAGEKVAAEVERGRPLSEAFKGVALFPYSMWVAVSAASKGVSLPAIMEGLSRIYIEQSNSIVKRFTTVLEPALIVVVGAIVLLGLLTAWSPSVVIVKSLLRGG